MKVIGIDPGCNGALVAIDTEKPLREGVECHKLPETVGETWQLLASYSDATAYMEPVSASQKQNGKGAITSGRRAGWLQMGLLAAGISTVEVKPKDWQRALGISPTPGNSQSKGANDAAKKEHKRKLRQRSEQLFPWIKMTDWKADALLIAWYGTKQVAGIQGVA